MARAAGVVLIALGAFLALPQICVDAPAQRVFVLGLVLALIGGLIVCDHAPGGTVDGRG